MLSRLRFMTNPLGPPPDFLPIELRRRTLLQALHWVLRSPTYLAFPVDQQALCLLGLFGTRLAELQTLMAETQGDHLPGCDIGPDHTGACSVPLTHDPGCLGNHGGDCEVSGLVAARDVAELHQQRRDCHGHDGLHDYRDDRGTCLA